MADRLKIALAQFPDDTDAQEIVTEAAAQGADILVFPEMWSNGYSGFKEGDDKAEARWRAEASSLTGPFVEAFATAAKRHGIHVVTTFLEHGEPHPFNTALLLNPQGNPVLHHRKVHTCFFGHPENLLGKGEEFATAKINTSIGPVTIGLMICMDREYAHGAEALSQAGAEVILVPNCCPLRYDAEVDDVRIASARGRAFETVIAMAVANYPTPKADGHSFVVDPKGKIIAQAGSDPELLVADIDIQALRKIRKQEWFRWQR